MKNHYVPEFYFTPWLNKSNQLFQYGWRRRGLVADLKTPGQICYVKDATTFVAPAAPSIAHSVEEWLSKAVDSQAAPIIRQILSSGLSTIDDKQRSHMTRFMLSLLARRPDNMEQLATAPEDLVRNLEKEDAAFRADVAALEKPPVGVPGLVAATRILLPGLIENYGRRLVAEIANDENYGNKVFALDWWGCDFRGTSTVPQFTSDRALEVEGKGIDDPDQAWILPLSPYYVLYATGRKATERLKSMGKGLLGLGTMQTILRRARRNAFGMAGSNLNLVEKWLPRRNGPV